MGITVLNILVNMCVIIFEVILKLRYTLRRFMSRWKTKKYILDRDELEVAAYNLDTEAKEIHNL